MPYEIKLTDAFKTYTYDQDYETAIADFEKALKVDPSQAVNYANIGSNYRDMGKTDLAIRYYKTALEIDPSIEFARDSLERLERLVRK